MDMHWPYHLEEALIHPKDIAQAWQDLLIMNGRSNSTDGSETITAAQRDHFLGLYKQSLQYLDTQIGRLMNHLEKLGYDSNTIIILLSDHGEEFLDHGRWGHWESNLYDEILRVPLIIRMPGWSGKVIGRQVRLLDLMPSILDICGCPLPGDLMGVSLKPLWTQDEAEYEVEAAISEMRRDPWHRIAVRTEAFKYIWDSKRPDQPDLYDLRADPAEKQNVSQRYPQEVIQFQAQVDAHRLRVAATEPAIAVPKLELDEEVAKRLRDLGYL
jgi:arylsulfatase A-like enzyme